MDSDEEAAKAADSARGRRAGHVELAVSASYVFVELWAAEASPRHRGPWRLVVLPRGREGHSGDDLSGGLSEALAAAAHTDGRCVLREPVAFRDTKPWRSLLTQCLGAFSKGLKELRNHIWYLLSKGRSLHVLLLNQSPVRVITNLLIFENRSKAAALCALNDWNPKPLGPRTFQSCWTRVNLESVIVCQPQFVFD